MKPFDLEAAKRGDPIFTRDGRRAHFVGHTDKLMAPFEVVAVVGGDLLAYTKDGRRFPGTRDVPRDLFMAPKTSTAWVNIYWGGYAHWSESEALADEAAGSDRLGGRAWPVEIGG